MVILQQLARFLESFEIKATAKWFLLSAVVGVAAGVAAIGFQLLGQAVFHFTLGEIAGYHPPEPAGEHRYLTPSEQEFLPWMVVVVIAGGGIVSGFLVYRYAPEAEGHGTDAAIKSFHHDGGRIRSRIPIVKMLASAATIGTGGSGGREGPIAQIGAGFGSFLATQLKLSARDRRILMAAGMGAGIGAIFRAPLAGALFAGEILYRDADLESDVIVPAAISSIIGYSVYSLSLPVHQRFAPLFDIAQTSEFLPQTPLELFPLALLAVVLVLVGIVYIKLFYGTHRLFQKLPIHPYLRPAVGAGLAGLAAVGLYFYMDRDARSLAVLSTGYGLLQEAFRQDAQAIGIGLLLAVALVKIVTTSLTIGSGGSGGVFGPSMVIGGCLGDAVGRLLHRQWETLVPSESVPVYAIVGMAGFFAGCAHAPFSTIIMVSEMTGSYNLLLPTMWVSTVCFLLCKRWSLYDQQVANRLESPAHRGDFIVDLLEGIKVAEVYQKSLKELVLIPESMSLEAIVHKLAETQQHYFPVVDEQGRMVGIFSSEDVRSYLYDETIWQLAVARDVMVTDIVKVTPDDDLNTALQRFTALNLDELPVVDPQDPGRLLGMLRRKETIAYYNRRLMEHKQAAVE